VTKPNVGIAEPFAARSEPEGTLDWENERGRIDKHEPVSIKKFKEDFGLGCCRSVAESVNKPQHRGSREGAVTAGDEISFL
jgi:hypothetical protein